MPRPVHVIEHSFVCPCCGAEISMLLDPSAAEQSYIEDCEVCCNPIRVTFEIRDGVVASFRAEPIGQ